MEGEITVLFQANIHTVTTGTFTKTKHHNHLFALLFSKKHTEMRHLFILQFVKSAYTSANMVQ